MIIRLENTCSRKLEVQRHFRAMGLHADSWLP
jgi:hypothetical protein